jgi:hypothetical protein
LGALFFCYGSAVPQSLKYSDIKKVTNIDSLENNLQPQRSLMYLNQSLSLEQRRFLIYDENLGSNFEDILFLAKQLGVEKSVILILQLWKGQLLLLSERNYSEVMKTTNW